MSKRIYVGNLPYSVTNEQLNGLFAEFGAVASADVVMDRDTHRSKGFGFVEMSDDSEADTAINGVNGKDVEGKVLVVNIAKPREDRPGGGGGNRGGGGGNRGGGGGGYGGSGGGGGGYGGGGGGGYGGGSGGGGGFGGSKRDSGGGGRRGR